MLQFNRKEQLDALNQWQSIFQSSNPDSLCIGEIKQGGDNYQTVFSFELTNQADI